MRSKRVAISGLMAFTLAISVGLAGFRSGSEEWFRSLYMMTTSALLVAILMSRISRGHTAAFSFGFAVFGWAYLILGLGFGPMADSNISEWDSDRLVNRYLLTTDLIKYAAIRKAFYSNIDEVGSYGYSIAIGHLIVSWLIAMLGGIIASALFACRRTAASARPSEPSGALDRKLTPNRKLHAVLMFAVVCPISIPVLHPTRRDYFPKESLFSADCDSIDMRIEIARVLDAMGEGSLELLPASRKDAEIYRFLVLHRLRHPISVRVEKAGGKLMSRVVVLDGIWPISTGLVAVDRKTNLQGNDWQSLTRQLKEVAFWEPPDHVHIEKVDCDNLIVFEGSREGRHRVVAVQDTRVSRDSDLQAVKRYMSSLIPFGIE